ncbi:MAG: sulfotransferase family 2 domain-containing protein [Bdellovibrionota bacterium]
MGYYPLVNHDHRFIFFWNAKCGCTTLKKVIYELAEGEFFEGNIHSHIGYLNSNKYAVPKEKLVELTGYRKIIVVRDPWSRLVSFYTNKIIVSKVETIIDRTSMLNVSNVSFSDMTQLMTIIKPECFQHHLELQASGLEEIEFDSVINLTEMSSLLPKELATLGGRCCVAKSLSIETTNTCCF